MRRFILVALLVVLLVGSGVALSQPGWQQSTTATAQEQPTVEPRVTPGTIVVGTALPMPTVPTVPRPTSQPVPDSPAPAPALASDTVLASYAFDSSDLSGWTFDQISDDPVAPMPWRVMDGTLRGLPNEEGFAPYNDTLALTPGTDAPVAALEASALAGDFAKVGLVLGYASNQDYLALIVNEADAIGQPHTGPGIVLVQVVAGEPVVLAQDAALSATPRTWYRLRLDVDDDDVTASLDGDVVLTAALDAPLAGSGTGLYAGSQGSARFDDLRLIGE